MLRRLFPVTALLLLAAATAAVQGAWTPATFPNPKTDLDKCGRGVPSNICDPDGILSKPAADRIEGTLKEIWDGVDPYVRAPCGSKGLEGYMVAVALMRSMEVPAGATAATQAQAFAKALHNGWQVGDAACNNGVLLFLAVQERQVYISTGAGAMAALPDSEVANIIDAMRPLLRKQQYDDAVEQVVVDIGLGLAGRRGAGEADTDWFAVCFFGVIALLLFNSCRRSWLRRREYRDCKRMLAKLKREQDQVRNHAWSAPASCPICLEDFNPPPTPRRPAGAATAAEDKSASAEAGPSCSGLAAPPEDSPSTSLLISMAGSGNGGGSGGEGEAGASDAESCSRGGGGIGGGGREGIRRRSVGKGLGSDGERGGGGARPRRPPVTLGCGHTFCDPCLTKWLEQKTTCPICRAKIGGGLDSSGPASPTRPSAASNPGSSNGAGAAAQGGGEASLAQAGANRALVADFWAMELAFRLGSLQRLYPSYVTPTLADQWVAEARETGTFNWEASREFQLQDPGVRTQHESSGGAGFSTSFGGGSSFGGGGGGGTW